MTSPRVRYLAPAAVWLAGSSFLFAHTPPNQTPLEKAWDVLQSATKEKSSERRSKAVRVLGLIPNDSKATALAEGALDDKEPQVRMAGAVALGEMPSPSSIPKLKDALSDRETAVVLAVAHALRDLHDDTAYELYYEVLTGERRTKEGLLAKPEAVLKDPKKLAQFSFEQGVGFFWFTDVPYSAFKALTKDAVSPIRAAAAKDLADDPDPHSSTALAKAASDKSWIVRAAALGAIARRGDTALLPSVLPGLTDEKEIVRYTAAAAVIRLSAANPAAQGQ